MSQSDKVLVTGAAGYIGRHVVKVLLDAGVHVLAADIHTENVDPRAEKIDCDIFSGDPDLFVKLGSPDICLHLAWKDGFSHESNAHIEMLSAHYVFLRNLINGGLRHLAVMGTMHEVGYFEGEINDDTPTNPLSLYGVAKNALRQSLFLLVKKHDIVLQWLRGFYIYGDDIHNHSVFTKIIEAEQRGQEFFPLTSGTNQCDYISIEELGRQIAAAIMQSEITGIINCCSGRPVPLRDIIGDFIARNHFAIKLQLGAYPMRPYDSPAIWGNNTKISRIMDRTTLF